MNPEKHTLTRDNRLSVIDGWGRPVHQTRLELEVRVAALAATGDVGIPEFCTLSDNELEHVGGCVMLGMIVDDLAEQQGVDRPRMKGWSDKDMRSWVEAHAPRPVPALTEKAALAIAAE